MTQRRRLFELTLNSHQYKMLTNVMQSLVFTGRSCVTVFTSQTTVWNLCQSFPSLTILVVYGLLLFLWCFSVFVNYYFQVSFNLKIVLSMAKINQNTLTEKQTEKQLRCPKNKSIYYTVTELL